VPAPRRDYADGTWITEAMQDAYLELHRAAIAHSVEVWDQGTGRRPVRPGDGQLFFGESMFSRADNASKYGFATWCDT
jgi:leucyl/phenylalanyl-tRNA--protein transferase